MCLSQASHIYYIMYMADGGNFFSKKRVKYLAGSEKSYTFALAKRKWLRQAW